MKPELPLLKYKIKDWDWNGSFDGAAVGDEKLLRMFYEAVAERWEAAGLGPINFESSLSWNQWAGIQDIVWFLLRFYAKEISKERKFKHLNVPNWDKKKEIFYKTKQEDPINGQDLDFIQTWRDAWHEVLPEKGLRRKYPLVIHRLDDKANGKSGRARFEAWNLDVSQNPDYTPEDQVKWSGKFFEGGNGSWKLSEDQKSLPTTIHETGRIQVGDYLGTWILEDIRDIINKLKRTYSYGSRAPYNGRFIHTRGEFDPKGTSSSFSYNFTGGRQYSGSSTGSENESIQRKFTGHYQNTRLKDGEIGDPYTVDFIAYGAVADFDASLQIALKNYGPSKLEGKPVPAGRIPPEGYILLETSAEYSEAAFIAPNHGWVELRKICPQIKYFDIGLPSKFKKCETHIEYTWNGNPIGDWVDARRFTKFAFGFPGLESSWNNMGFHNDFGAELHKLHQEYSGTFKGFEFLTDELHDSKPLKNFPSLQDITASGTVYTNNYADFPGQFVDTSIPVPPGPDTRIVFELTAPFPYAVSFFGVVGSSTNIKFATDKEVKLGLPPGSFKFLDGKIQKPGIFLGDAFWVTRVEGFSDWYSSPEGMYKDTGWGYKTKSHISIIDWTPAFKYKGKQ